MHSKRLNEPRHTGRPSMTVADLIEALRAMPEDAPVVLRAVLLNQAVRWDSIEKVELRWPDDMPPVVVLR